MFFFFDGGSHRLSLLPSLPRSHPPVFPSLPEHPFPSHTPSAYPKTPRRSERKAERLGQWSDQTIECLPVLLFTQQMHRNVPVRRRKKKEEISPFFYESLWEHMHAVRVQRAVNDTIVHTSCLKASMEPENLFKSWSCLARDAHPLAS